MKERKSGRKEKVEEKKMMRKKMDENENKKEDMVKENGINNKFKININQKNL